ncbi:MAG: excinuclease ABC subunit UvrA [Gemmatimonadetes bacterium]|nr:excinuclease ABC subunit UvrA [Gemmatimonadota bacterium]
MIEVRGAREHNLRGIDLDLPSDVLIAMTGVSGSGKSSLAFDTLYAEARRRFLLTEPAAQALVAHVPPPAADRIDGLSPAIAIGQQRQRPSARATAGTLSGIYDYLRSLYARVGIARCLQCSAPVHTHRFDEVLERARGLPEGTKLIVLAPLALATDPDSAQARIAQIERRGYRRLRVAGQMQLLEEVDASALVNVAIDVVVDRVVVKNETERRLKGSLQAAAEVGEGKIILLDHDSDDEQRFAVRPTCVDCGTPFPPLTSALFSYHGLQGACGSCRGSGMTAAVPGDGLLSAGESPLVALQDLFQDFGQKRLQSQIQGLGKRLRVDVDAPLAEWSEAAATALWDGESRRGGFVGLRRHLQRLRAGDDEELTNWIDAHSTVDTPCAHCSGTRLSRAARAVQVQEVGIDILAGEPLSALILRLQGWDLPPTQATIAAPLLRAIHRGAQGLIDLGLGYLTLDRRADSLSAGELQRVQLVAALSSGVTQVLYVFDEPSAGLHARDAERLLQSLRGLQAAGNSVIVVEHDPALIAGTDVVVELGPGAGRRGGECVDMAPPHELAMHTATAKYLDRRDRPSLPRRGRAAGDAGWLRLMAAAGHNLQGIDVDFPLGLLTAVTGISGSGKSTLVHDTLYPLLASRHQRGERPPLPNGGCVGDEGVERVVAVDQAPIGRSARSNAATYTGLHGVIRNLFSELPEARLRGYRPGQFSFNSDGACPACGGSGVDATGLAWEGIAAACASCGGRRYRREVLEIRFREHSIADILDLDVGQARQLFGAIPEAARRLQLLADLGLDYLVLGQPASTLSGGEAQRVKLAADLGRPHLPGTIYILDEPTSGLHPDDVGYLVELLQRLVDQGNSVIVVEHNLQLIAAADWVIDLGPGAGEQGGRVVATGTPSTVAACDASVTGEYLVDWTSS